jgi:hypothetical protein
MLIRGLKPVSRRLPKFLRNAIRAHRFYYYGWGVVALMWALGYDRGVRRSNRVYNFVANRHKTGLLFDSRGPE